MTLLFRLILAMLVSLAAANVARAQDTEVMVVLDVSGSMWGQIDGVAKIEIARDVFADLSGQWNSEGVNAGLIAYGHRRKGDCRDIELLSRPSAQATAGLGALVNGLVPKGKTPLSDAVRLAAEEMKFTEKAATVILLSDGIETCNADPCALGAQLEDLGVDFTAHVIGFDIAAEQDKAQLQCLANATGGKYFDSGNADELMAALDGATDLSTPTEQSADTVPVLLALVYADGTSRPQRVNFFGTHKGSGTSRALGALQGTVEVVNGLSAELEPGEWLIEAVSEEGQGVISVTVTDGNQVVRVPFAANPVSFDLREAGPYALGVQQTFYLSGSAPLQPGAEYTVALFPKGATSFDQHIYRQTRFGSDDVTVSSHQMASPNAPGDYELLVMQGYDPADAIARFPVRYEAGIAPRWDGSRSGPPGTTLPLSIRGNTYRSNRITFTKGGVEFGSHRVGELSRADGPILPLPDEPGEYEIVYDHVDGNGDWQSASLGVITVEEGGALPDDPDAVAPPSDGRLDRSGGQGLPADEHGWEPVSEPSRADPEILSKPGETDFVFVCRQEMCSFDDPETGLRDIPLLGDFGIVQPTIWPSGKAYIELVNEWNGEWVILNPGQTSSDVAWCADFTTGGWHGEIPPGASFDTICNVRRASGYTSHQAEILANWQAQRNQRAEQAAVQQEADAMGGEELPLIPAGEMQGNWVLRDRNTGTELLRAQIMQDEGSDSLYVSAAASPGGPFGGIMKSFGSEPDMLLARDGSGTIGGINVDMATRRGPIQGVMLRPPEWDGQTDVWYGMLLLFEDENRPVNTLVDMVRVGDDWQEVRHASPDVSFTVAEDQRAIFSVALDAADVGELVEIYDAAQPGLLIAGWIVEQPGTSLVELSNCCTYTARRLSPDGDVLGQLSMERNR